MEYSNITKGDWEARTERNRERPYYTQVWCGDLMICDTYRVNTATEEEATANAQAIASLPQLLKESEELKALQKSFYMDICRAYNAGKQNQTNILLAKDTPDEDKMFLSSHDYFTTEFTTFKTNVP